MEDAVPTGLNEEAAPQGTVAVEHAPRREVLSRRQRDRESPGARGLPPVDFLDLNDARRPEQPAIADRCHDLRIEAPLE